jgi:hypothetical protein
VSQVFQEILDAIAAGRLAFPVDHVYDLTRATS